LKDKLKGWQELPLGGIIKGGGTADNYETGNWRVKRPVIDFKKCIHCLLCWVYCPDSSIIAKDGKVLGVDYRHCKGCGICSVECPEKVKAITMVKEK